jgi:hypothetical protein
MVWIGNRIYWTLKQTVHDYTLQITIAHGLVFSVTLLGSGFQPSNDSCPRWLAPSAAAPELHSLASNCRTNSQSDGHLASLSWCQAPIWGPRPHYYYCRTVAGLLMWGRQDGSVVYNCCWASPAQSFSGPSPVGLVTIFYCPIFEISLFVDAYDSQGYGGGIRSRLHTGYCQFLKLK